MTVKQRLTADELWEMPEVPGTRYELVEGELVEMPGTGALHGLIVKTVLLLLDAHVKRHRLGIVLGDGVSYVLSREPDLLRIPDVSFVSHPRIPTGGPPEGYWPFSPDLAVEIVSPSDRFSDVLAKVHEYLAAGTQLVWVVWPEGRSVIVHTVAGVAELTSDDALSGAEVLPGFEVRVEQLFDQEI